MAVDPLQEYEFEIPEVRDQSGWFSQNFDLAELVESPFYPARFCADTEIEFTQRHPITFASPARSPFFRIIRVLPFPAGLFRSVPRRQRWIQIPVAITLHPVDFLDMFSDHNRSSHRFQHFR